MNCFYCDVTLTPPPKPRGLYPKGFRFPKTMYTRDHLVPKSRGGTEFVPSCFACNSEKGLLSLEEFRILVGFRLNFESWWSGSYTFPGEAAKCSLITPSSS